VGIINMANGNLHMAVVIAVRYSAVRRQFGPAGGEELAVLEYQTQQRRLMPLLAACFAHHHFSMTFYEDFFRLVMGRLTGEDPGLLAALGMEVHGVSSCGKPVASWTAQAAAQEAREACGGHGFLSAAGLGRIRGDNDANCTYEGDNTVLLQQTSQWLLGLRRQVAGRPGGRS
jgi:acyl-CoA oxidase